MAKTDSYERVRQFLRGVATTDYTMRKTGFLPHKLTPGEVKECVRIIEDDSMSGVTGCRAGDVILSAKAKAIPPGSDLRVQIQTVGLRDALSEQRAGHSFDAVCRDELCRVRQILPIG